MENIERAVDDVLAKLREQEEQVIETKKVVNSLLRMIGKEPLFTDLAVTPNARAGFKRDQFYGQPLSTVVRDILTARRATGDGPATVAEIYSAMIEGGFKFEASNAENAKRALRISLTKNSAIFHRLPSGHYGLLEWYPNAKESKPKATFQVTADDGGEDGFDMESKEKADRARSGP